MRHCRHDCRDVADAFAGSGNAEDAGVRVYTRTDLVGQRYGRWTVIKDAEDRGKYRYLLCRCDCGTEKEVRATGLTSGVTESCGCLKSDLATEQGRTHGESKHPLYKIWSGIIQRCSNPNAPGYGDYGGRGISVCPQWCADFASFL